MLPLGHVLITEIANGYRSDHSRVRQDDLTHHIAEYESKELKMTRRVNTYYAVQVELLNKVQPGPECALQSSPVKHSAKQLIKLRFLSIESTEHGSWPDWEEENGEKVRDDAHWIKIMEDNGFIVAAAELKEDE